MNIRDHSTFIESLIRLPILQSYINNIEASTHSIIYKDSNNNLWEAIIKQINVSVNQHQIRDFKINLHKNNHNSLLQFNLQDGTFLDTFFNVETENQANLHIVAIESDDTVQYITVKDNRVVPSTLFLSHNSQAFDEIHETYRTFIKSIDPHVEFKEEIIITLLDDIRTKVTQIITEGACDHLISLRTDELFLSEQDIQGGIKETFFEMMEEHPEFNQLTDEQKEALFNEVIHSEIDFFIQTASGMNTNEFDNFQN